MSPVGRPSASGQLRRLLVMVPWVLERSPVALAEVARQFNITKIQAEADLSLASLIGVPPYDSGDYLDLWFEGGDVHAFDRGVLNRPPRLSEAEGYSLLAAGKALLSIPGAEEQGPLARALTKLEAVLGDPGRVSVHLADPAHLDTVRRAAREGRQLRVRYYTAWRDDESDRKLEPRVVFNDGGRWYVDALDDHSGQVRRFRVDRIVAAEETGARFDPAVEPPPAAAYQPGPDGRAVVLDLPASARWVVEAYPVECEEQADGRLRVTATVVGTAWLERLLLRVGPGAAVLEPDDLRDLADQAAQRLLELYQR